MSGLTYQEVVDHVLTENRRASEQSLRHLQERHTGSSIRQTRPPGRASRRKLIRGVRASRGSRSVSHITRLNSGRNHQRAVPLVMMVRSAIGAQAEVAPAPVANDAPSESAVTPVPDPSPAEDQAQAMEVDDYAACPSLPSPVSREDDELLPGLPQSEATEVESGLAHLTVSSPRSPNGEGEEASL